MSCLFTPFTMGKVTLKNRFVFSACEDNLCDNNGSITNKVIRKNQKLARGEVALIISSQAYVHPLGRSRIGQPGIHSDKMIPGLRNLASAVHDEGGKFVFQLGHAGINAQEKVIGRQPLGPSTKTGGMTKEEIREVIHAYGEAAMRATEAGADGIQLHAAHGYLINQFLSPFYNHRDDIWGGSEENRFRLLKEIIKEVKKNMAAGMILLVKLNSHDYTPQQGITPPLAANYARRLADERIDALEVSCGNSALAPWNLSRGEVPVKEILGMVPEEKRTRARETLEKIKDNFKIEEGYNLNSTMLLKQSAGEICIFAVGGWRHFQAMEDAVTARQTDLISMCRPLIREPSLIKKFKEGRVAVSSCINCNRCMIALAHNLPGRCYYKGLPDSV